MTRAAGIRAAVTGRPRAAVALAIAALAVATMPAVTGCVMRPAPSPVVAGAPPGFPDAWYRDAATRGEPVYAIDTDRSVVQILVYRDGALARLGHDHAVTAGPLVGYLWPGGIESAGRADLYLALSELVVDAPQARAAAGLGDGPTAADIDGTRRNMLASLEADRYPHVWLQVLLPPAESGQWLVARDASVDLTLHGTTRRLSVPVRIAAAGDAWRVTGTFTLRQSDFGITPFSVLGGALAVRDALELAFDLRFAGFRDGS